MAIIGYFCVEKDIESIPDLYAPTFLQKNGTKTECFLFLFNVLINRRKMNATNNGCNAAKEQVAKTVVTNRLVEFLKETPYSDLIETYAFGQRDAAMLQIANPSVDSQELGMLIYQYGELLKVLKGLDN